MKQTLNINFYCRKSKANKQGLAPIEVSLIINGKRTYIALQRKAKPDEFEKSINSKKDNPIKQYCEQVRIRLNTIIDNLFEQDIELTAPTLKQYFLKGGVSTIYTLDDMISEFLEIQKRKVGTQIIEETYNRYIEAKDKFYSILNLTGEESAKSITHQHILQFKASLLAQYKQDTAAHYMTRVKSFFRYGFESGKVPVFAFTTVQIEKEKNKKIIYLTDEEIKKIKEKKYSSTRLYNVSRLFLFQCYTGLAYADMALLEKDDFKENKLGQIYITKPRKKTGVEFTAVLLNDAKEIAKEYDYKLPVLSNQKYNAYLKEIADLCGIEKNLTTHIARHTCACYLLNNLKSENAMEIVAKVMGHSDTKVTRKYYAAIFDDTVFDSISISGISAENEEYDGIKPDGYEKMDLDDKIKHYKIMMQQSKGVVSGLSRRERSALNKLK